MRGIQDTRQIVDSNTNDIENNDKKGGSRFHNIRQLMKKKIDKFYVNGPTDIKFYYKLMKGA